MAKGSSISFLLLASLTAAATSAPPFDEVDVNRDGMISPEEVVVIEGLDWSTADKNQDGTLDPAEYDAFCEESRCSRSR